MDFVKIKKIDGKLKELHDLEVQVMTHSSLPLDSEAMQELLESIRRENEEAQEKEAFEEREETKQEKHGDSLDKSDESS